MKVAPIRTDADYEVGLERAAALAHRADRVSVDELEILGVLLERWERSVASIPAPTPLEAIRFRMRQGGLKPRDLEPFVGSRARVSEILSGTRPLTLDMIKALHRHLGIPAAALLGQAEPRGGKPALPAPAAVRKLRSMGVLRTGEDIEAFMSRALGPGYADAHLRKSRTDRTNAKTDHAALAAWIAAAQLQAATADVAKPKRGSLSAHSARRLARLSVLLDGPIEAKAELSKLGVILIVLEHLPGTYLDGAAMCRRDGTPVIALTLRHDRLDNFWFTLLHEFGHVCLHLRDGTTLILDDLEIKCSDEIEAEADAFALEALVPSSIWASHDSDAMSSTEIDRAATAAGVHPAIVAGRWQREHRDYRRFAKMLGRGEVRSMLFTE